MLINRDGAERIANLALDSLKNQDYFNADNEALIALIVGALIKHADDEPHIGRMIETWIESTRQMLHPADVKLLAAATSNRVELPAGCKCCEVEGTRGTAGGVQYLPYVMVEKAGGVGANRCGCARGERLKQMDLERAKQDKAARPVHADIGVLEQFAEPDQSS
jgi:hypothetical protein